MPYQHKVHIRWSRPINIDETCGISTKYDNGIYMITRKYIRNDEEWEALLYVGVTTRNFYDRIAEHYRNNSKWCSAYGKKYIRFGTVFMYIIHKYDQEKLLTDIETDIIQNLNSIYPNELINIRQVSSYKPNYYLEIYHHNNSWLTRFNHK